jgi:hypothetical protein
MKRIALAVVAALTLLLGASAAAADPDFGPGNSSKGPNDPGAQCHPPGQTVDEPGLQVGSSRDSFGSATSMSSSRVAARQ